MISVTVAERGGVTYTARRTVDLDLEGRIPADAHADLYRALEDFIATEWTERIARTF